MSLWKYRYFVDVVDMKSFTKAGKKNFITQTAVSQQIADLEKQIGGQLIRRESGTWMLTELGKIVYDHAEEILKIDERMKREIEQYKGNYVIKIGIDSSINKRLWAKMQEMIDNYYSEEDFEFNTVDRMSGSRRLEEGSLDIYIGYELRKGCRKEEIEAFEIDRNPIGIYLGEKTGIRGGGQCRWMS